MSLWQAPDYLWLPPSSFLIHTFNVWEYLRWFYDHNASELPAYSWNRGVFFSSHNAEPMHIEQTWNLCIPERHSLLQPEAEQISQEPTSVEFVNVETSRINSSGDIFSPRKRQARILRMTKLYFDLLKTTGSAHTTWPIYIILLVFLYCQHLSDVCFQPHCVRVSLSRAQERVFRSDGVQLCRVAQSNLFSPRALFHRSYDWTCETEKGGRADTQRK